MAIRRPCIRAVDAFPVVVDGQQWICLRDPERIAPEPLVLSPTAFVVAGMLDGTRTILEVQAEFARRAGDVLTREQAQELVEQLDQHCFLDSPRFMARAEQVLTEFRESKVRRSAHAGLAYPDDPEALRDQVLRYFEPPEGPGLPGPATNGHLLKGIMAPHIDLRQGGHCCAHAYRALCEESEADLFVVLGIAHQGHGSLFLLTHKDFGTPLGVVPTAGDIVERLAEGSKEDPFAEEMVHRLEHSIEFQLIFLQTMLQHGGGKRRDFEIVPVLCGSFQPFVEADAIPAEDPRVRAFIDDLRESLDRSGRKWCVIASVDLSHVGRKFGHGTTVVPGTLRSVELQDRWMLSHVMRCDTHGFMGSFRRDMNARNVDAVSATAVLMEATGARKSRLLKYGTYFEDTTSSAVTYASMGFY